MSDSVIIRRWRRGIMLFAAAVGLLFALSVWDDANHRLPRENRRLHSCGRNLKQIEIALHIYHDEYGCFPPAVVYGPDGRPWHSWRVLILPYLEQGILFGKYRFDEPWDGPNNLRLLTEQESPPVFHCPTDPATYRGDRRDPAGFLQAADTSYVAIIGENTLWPPQGTRSFTGRPETWPHTIHVIEFPESGIKWTEPRDLQFEDLVAQVKAGRPPLRGPHRIKSWPYLSAERRVTQLSFLVNVPPMGFGSIPVSADEMSPAEFLKGCELPRR